MIAVIAALLVLGSSGAPATEITDGDRVRLVARLSARAPAAQHVAFALDGTVPVAACSIAAGASRCSSETISTLGWHWARERGGDVRTIVASLDGGHGEARLTVGVLPRPVVLVHGILSAAGAWHDYLGSDGFLARIGLSGYAVGDGRAPGKLDMGALLAPTHQTNTIAQNAAVLASYIAGVKRRTGAQMIDIVAHSMGGLATRYYVARLMKRRDVAEVIMLGTPNGGSDCAALPAALGFYAPATLELRPSYVRDVFDRAVTERRGVQFYAVAGTKVTDTLTAACTDVPSDLVVSLASVSTVVPPVGKPPVLHTFLEHDPDVFWRNVAPLLERPPTAFAATPAAEGPPRVAPDSASFGRVATGHIPPGGRAIVPVAIDAGVTLAGFALYDRSRSLDVQVRGASGKVVHLDTAHAGLVVVDDPTSLVTLGYGFTHPRPGPWLVTLRATPRTPESGADFALAARLVGGARLETTIQPAIVHVGASVAIAVRASDRGKPIDTLDVAFVIRKPSGASERLPLRRDGDVYRARWKPAAAGLYGVDISATGTTPDGAPLERSAFRTVVVR